MISVILRFVNIHKQKDVLFTIENGFIPSKGDIINVSALDGTNKIVTFGRVVGRSINYYPENNTVVVYVGLDIDDT